MKPSLDQLEALLWIAKLGSFRRAAAKLHVSQPAISSRIGELEEQLGFKVVDRSGHKPRLTAEGQEVVRYAEQMIALAENFRSRLVRQNTAHRSIRMGAADTFALTCLSPLLERLAALYPQTQIELDIDFSAKLDRKLQLGELDIAFLTSPNSHDLVYAEPLIHLELGWVASPRLLLGQNRLAPADMLALPIITNPRPSHLYRTVMDWFSADGYIPRRVHTCTSLTIMANLTANGFGIAVMPLVLVREELRLRRLVSLPTTDSLPSHYISAAYRIENDREMLAEITAMAHTIVAERHMGSTGR